jgi:hypothetical protein
MSTGMHYLDVGLFVAMFTGAFWWMYVLTSKSHAQRRLERVVRKTARQSWNDDRAGGRGNRSALDRF